MHYWLSLLAEIAPDEDKAAALIDRALEVARTNEEDWYLPEPRRSGTPAQPR